MDSSGLKEDIFYSSSWMQEILDTSWCRDWQRQKLTDLLPRVSQSLSTTCPVDALRRIS